MTVSKEALRNLTTNQLKVIVKKIKEKLSLNISGKNKEDIIDVIFNLDGGNKFFGKKLLSFDNSGHVKVPMREQGFKSEQQKSRAAQNKIKKQIEQDINNQLEKKKYSKSDDGKLDKLEKQLLNLSSEDPKYNTKLQVIQAKFRGIARRFAKNQ